MVLTRQPNGMFMLSAFTPIIATVSGVGVEDLYVRPRDPIGVRNLCEAIVGNVFGDDVWNFDPLHSYKVRLAGEIIRRLKRPPSIQSTDQTLGEVHQQTRAEP